MATRSSIENEFRAMTQGICDLMWLRILFKELQVNVETPIRLYCDNKTTISIVHNLVHHD